MAVARNNIFKFLTTIQVVLIAFLLLRSCQYIYSLIYTSENTFLVAGRTLALVSYFVLSYLTYKQNIIACWAMVILLSLSGVSIFLFGIFAASVSQYVFKLLNIVIGVYFSYGAIILFNSIRKGEVKGIKSMMKA